MTLRTLQIRPTNDCPATCGTCGDEASSEEMSVAAVAANLDHLCARYPIEDIVLSGAGTVARDDFPELLALLHERRFRQVTLLGDGAHWTSHAVEAIAGVVHRVVIRLNPKLEARFVEGEWSDAQDWAGTVADALRAIAELRAAGLVVQTHTELRRGTVSVLPSLADAIDRLDVSAPTFAYPFASGPQDDVLPWPAIRAVVQDVLGRLRHRAPRLKNVPVCALGSLAAFAHRTQPRLYIKHDRQFENHAQIPPFVGLGYGSSCHGCAAIDQCDGYWERHLKAGRIAPPTAL
ncbi:MAG: hypothetical protein AAGE52_12890 [Myxococcota bacterium]